MDKISITKILTLIFVLQDLCPSVIFNKLSLEISDNKIHSIKNSTYTVQRNERKEFFKLKFLMKNYKT